MTTRDHARRRLGDTPELTRPAVTAEPAPGLPERLLAARERKGVDLYRAERDTKIRARYLAALERGDYRELPGAVYTKGFLRNYALYLGLDPEDILGQWHRERGEGGVQEPVVVVPRALEAPRQGLMFTPGILVAALLTIGVLLFVGYLGMQVLRYAKPPTIAVTDPATAVTALDETATSYALKGTSMAGATVTISVTGQDDIQVTAASDGTWTATVPLRRGQNRFVVTAVDPETGKSADEPVPLFITVPLPAFQTATLNVDQPTDGATFQNGAIPVQGSTTNAASVTVSAAYVGPVGAATVARTPTPGTSPSASPSPTPAAPAAQTVTPATDGTFSVPFELTAGRWTLTITATSSDGKAQSVTRAVTVSYQGVNLVVSIKNSSAWLKVWVDGQIDPDLGAGGRIYAPGKTLTFSGQQTVEVRTGSSGSTYFTLNGTSLGALGKPGVPETWLFAPTGQPALTQHK